MDKVNKSKLVKAMLIAALVSGLAVPLSGCTPGSEASMQEYQVATVGRGNITVDIAAAGNLSYALVKDLAFEIRGDVEEVLVKEGDEISQGQVLASLDTSDLELAVTNAEKAVKNAQVALLQAQASRASAKASLEQAEDRLREAKRQGLYGPERRVIELNLEAAEWNLEASELRLEIANSDLVSAEEDLVKAQADLAKATIVAPFDGFVTRVNVEGGDEVAKGTVAMQVVDPTRFKAEILVSERDIFSVRLGKEARVQVDALPMLNIPARVTHISPTATIQAGVVNYEVEVELGSLEIVKQEMLEAMREQQEAMQESAFGEMAEQIKEAIEQGLISQEEAEEMMKAAQQRQSESIQEQQQAMIAMLEDIQLKEGLNVTVSVIVDEASNVLLVPNGAITYQGTRAYVQVLTDGVIEERLIQTGINNWQYTEVVDGLAIGEQVVISGTAGTVTPTTPGQEQQRPLGPMFR